MTYVPGVERAPSPHYRSQWTRVMSVAAIALFGAVLVVPVRAIQPLLPQFQTAAAADSTTTIIILGVDHSAQLGARRYHPGYFRAFFDRVRPSAICIERSPDEFARGDFYEFTYEAQHIAVPYARDHHLDICPIDWLPSRDDERLAFGRLEVVDPPMVRPASGFQAFLVLDSASLHRSLFFADSEPSRLEARAFFDAPRAAGTRDFPRRLDLYRTYMQAMRILSAARSHRGKTLVVVVGATHKDDLERILSGVSGMRIVQPSAIGAPSTAVAEAALTRVDLAAILSFNLFGAQSLSGRVDWPWIEEVINKLAPNASDSAELELFRTRLAVLHDGLVAREAATRYERVARSASPSDRFTYDGVLDPRRIDSYYDPFGNLTVRERAALESAREWQRVAMSERVAAIRAELVQQGNWTALKRAEFDEYWNRYIASAR